MSEQIKAPFEMGPLQKFWLKSLREHPERQIDGILGQKDPDNKDGYFACCLGELLLCDARFNSKPLPFVGDIIVDKDPSVKDEDIDIDNVEQDEDCMLSFSYEKYGLRNMGGELAKPVTIDDKTLNSLVEMNDSGISWTLIANYIEQNLENVFTKSV